MARPQPPLTFLIDVSSATQLTLGAELARRLLERSATVSLNYSGTSPEARASTLSEAERLGVQVTLSVEMADKVHVPGTRRAFETIYANGRWTGLRMPSLARQPRFRQFVLRFIAEKIAAEKILARTRPDVVVVPEDGVSSNAALCAAARRRSVPVLVCPFGAAGQEDFDNYVDEKHAEGTLILLPDDRFGRAIRDQCPQWIRDTRYGHVLMFPPDYILARETTAMSLRDPWTVHGGTSARIAVESSRMLALYRREGMPEEKLTVTGSAYCDVVADEIHSVPDVGRAFDRGERITPDRTRVLVSLPPSYHGTRPGRCEFPDYLSMWKALADLGPAFPNMEFAFSIHPGTSLEDRERIEALGIPITSNWILREIPRADVFVTTFSSTVRWALACGKPVVNYDAYDFALEIYDGEPGFSTSNVFQDVRERLAWLERDENYRDVARQTRESREEWGLLDGRACDRILETARALVDGSTD